MNLKEKYNNLPESKKAIVKMLIVLVLLIVVFVIIIAAMGGSNKKQSYSQFEKTILRGAERYVNNNPNFLEDQSYGSKLISLDALVDGGYIKPVSKYLGKDNSCSGGVLVYKNLDNFKYVAKVDCGSEYRNKSLYEHIMEKESTVTSGAGLYKTNDGYVYRGEYVDNYVSINGKIWRIMSIDEDGNLKLISEERTKTNYVWDDRYNSIRTRAVGINDFIGTEASRIKNTLEELYNENEILDSEFKAIVYPKNYCIGKRSESNNKVSLEEPFECSTTTEQVMGFTLPTVNELLIPSIDDNCTNMYSAACLNYNYMSDFLEATWTLTASADDTYQVYSYTNGIDLSQASRLYKLNIVTTIFGDINYDSGDGSETNPYIIK